MRALGMLLSVVCLRGFAQTGQRGLVAEAAHRGLFELTRAVAGEAQLPARRLDRALAAVAQSKAQLDDAALLARQAPEGVCDRALELAGLGLLARVRPLAGDEVAEVRVAVVADRHVEARHVAPRLAQRQDLRDGHVGRRRDLLVGRVVRELRRQVALDPGEPALALLDVRREADRPRRVRQAALDALTDPERGVRRELEALAPVELLGGANEPQRALLDEVAERQTQPLVAARLRDDEPQVRIDHAVLGSDVAALDALGKLDLL